MLVPLSLAAELVALLYVLSEIERHLVLDVVGDRMGAIVAGDLRPQRVDLAADTREQSVDLGFVRTSAASASESAASAATGTLFAIR
jgi:hypothetical protein